MLNVKKALLTGAILSALCVTAFASESIADKPKCEPGKDRPAICDQRGGFERGHKFKKMSPEQREKLRKESAAKREAWKKMSPEQRKEHMKKFRAEQKEKRMKLMNEKMKQLSPEQRVEVKKYMADQKAHREAMKKHRQDMKARMEKMSPEQKEVIKLSQPPKFKKMHKGPGQGKHFQGKHFKGEKPMRGEGFKHHAPEAPKADK